MNIRSLRFRMTVWYAGLLAGALLIFGVSVYLGLEHYLDSTVRESLASEGRAIATELLSQLPGKSGDWLKTEIDEAYAPEANARFIRVLSDRAAVIYLSGVPKDGAFDPAKIPAAREDQRNSVRKIRLANGRQLIINSMTVTTPDSNRFLVESGMPYQPVQIVLHGLLSTLAIYAPVIVMLAALGGYGLMRRSLRAVDDITVKAESITSTNLNQRLPILQTGDELERLTAALNRMIERIEDAFQQVNRFSADASHELRTPLTILQLELESIAHNSALNASLEERIGSALEETHRMSRIVESLLAISRLDAGEVQLDKSPLNFAAIVISTVTEMEILAQDKPVTLQYSGESNVWVDGDRTRLQQVILNLIDNAIKYTPEGGAVEVRVQIEDSRAVLEVVDSGIGIPAYAIAHVFERFYRVDKARSRASGGAGLGLAIVKSICAAHGAEISVSSHEGRGSCFRVELPLGGLAAGKQQTGKHEPVSSRTS